MFLSRMGLDTQLENGENAENFIAGFIIGDSYDAKIQVYDQVAMLKATQSRRLRLSTWTRKW